MTGHKDIFFEQFRTFTRPDRDPRFRVISIGYIALIASDKIADFTAWHDSSNLREMAFDHKEIAEEGKRFLKDNLNTIVIKQFLPKDFPLNLLQEAYEIIEGKNYDNRNFRKKMLVSGIVAETQKTQDDVSHRPAKLYRFVRA